MVQLSAYFKTRGYIPSRSPKSGAISVILKWPLSAFIRTAVKAANRLAASLVPASPRPESTRFPRAASQHGGRGLSAPRGGCAGFTYIGLLLLVAMMGVALTVVAEDWQTVQKRDKEEELLFVGNQFRRAIAMYAASGSSYPRSLDDLLKDPRFPGARRFLRKIFRDPITGRTEWGLLKPDGNGIVGVYSLSDAEPMKQSGFNLVDRGFEGKKKYSEWVFSPVVGQAPSAGPSRAGSVTPQPGVAQPDTTQFGTANAPQAGDQFGTSQANAPQSGDTQASTPPAGSAQPAAPGAQPFGNTQPGTTQDDALPFSGGRSGFRARR